MIRLAFHVARFLLLGSPRLVRVVNTHTVRRFWGTRSFTTVEWTDRNFRPRRRRLWGNLGEPGDKFFR